MQWSEIEDGIWIGDGLTLSCAVTAAVYMGRSGWQAKIDRPAWSKWYPTKDEAIVACESQDRAAYQRERKNG